MAYLSSILTPRDIAISIGTSNTQVHINGHGVIFNEPTVVTIDCNGYTKKRDGHVVAVGYSAKKMLGRTPQEMYAIRPIKKSIIVDFEGTIYLIKGLIEKVFSKSFFRKPRMILTVPAGITEIESILYKNAAHGAEASETYLIQEPIAMMIGLGIDAFNSTGQMIISAGGGVTNVSIVSFGKIIYNRSLRIGGEDMDEAVLSLVKDKHSLLIGENTAESVRYKLTTIVRNLDFDRVAIKGRSVFEGIPNTSYINNSEVQRVADYYLNLIIDAIRVSVESVPRELIGEVISNGIILSGGLSLMEGFKDLIELEIGIPMIFMGDFHCAALGASMVLKEPEKYEQILIL